ncbi:hypothetical protein FANTH_10164 [Fusarium anthophilum]|uniref:Xylanolytic transcriptional activator regulatory domain-containing protein n=1 Tax=Fusarium anthophilum TaxID=48485 RepID=A0A8H5DXD2_9HYPO|nr:hypothetical protein FANTH_10164 [Fusarium anthophilum]
MIPAVRVDQQPLAQLETRLRDMERLLHRLVPDNSQELLPSSTLSAQNDSREGGTYPSSVDTHGGDAISQGTIRVELASDTSKSVWPTHFEDSVDGMGSITFKDETSSGVFGPTSNSAFFKKIISAQHLILRQGQHLVLKRNDFHATTSLDISRPASPSPAPARVHSPPTLDPYVLPSYQDVLEMINIFFDNTGKFFPYLYKPYILRTFINMRRSSFQNVQRSQLCILNLLMAFATTHCPSNLPESLRVERGDIFLHRALLLIPDIEQAAGNLEPIQALLMATQYIQGTQRSSLTWDILRRLIHAAFQVGLYQPASQDHYSPLDAELRKRAWWMCFIMDRMCSMIYGRPQLVPNGYMVLDLPTDVELEMFAGSSPDNTTTSATSTPTLFIYSSQLSLILGQVIESVYDNNITHPARANGMHQMLKKVLEVDQDLTRWCEQLPPGLSKVTTSELKRLQGIEDILTYRFRTIVTLRYLNVRTLLHRAVLSRLLEPAPHPSYTDLIFNMSVSSMEVCVESALESLGIISHATHQQNLLPIWWYSVYYTFTAALVIYGSVLAIYRGNIQTHKFTLVDLAQALQIASELLERLGATTAQRREGQTHGDEEVQLIPPNASSDPLLSEEFMRGLDSDMTLDLSSFTDNMESLIPDTFPL